MPDDAADLQLALADVRMEFPGAVGAGMSDGTLTRWKEVYASARTRAMAPVRITASTFDGGSSQGLLQYDPRHLMRALLIRRAELDPDFSETAFAPAQIEPQAQNNGYVIQFGPAPYMP